MLSIPRRFFGLLRTPQVPKARISNIRVARSMEMERPAKVPRLKQESGKVAKVEVERYDELLQEKVVDIKEFFSGFKLPDVDVYPSAPANFRMRTEFRVWHEDEDLYYIMFEKSEDVSGRPQRVRKDTFPVASKLINELMPKVIEEAKKTEVLRKRLYQVNFHTTLKGEAMVSFIYHKKLGADWVEAARQLGVMLAEVPSCTTDRVHVIGRSKGQKICLDQDFVTEELTVDGQKYKYKQVECSFSQPNGFVCQHMLEWALDATRIRSENPESQTPQKSGADDLTKGTEEKKQIPEENQQEGGSSNVGHSGASERDFLELYCGNCNFTVPLAKNFRSAVATEISKVSIAAARDNLKDNGIENVTVARMSSEEFVTKYRSGAGGRRLEGLDLTKLDISTVLVDPPRCGLDEDTVKLVQEFDYIVYISCNPETLHQNLQELTKSHSIVKFAVFDQFPYTGHLECGAYLEKLKPVEQSPQGGASGEEASVAGNVQ
ncbi:hypothetical protein BSKO_06262 [Bryopsis sp. KO-2023]|nr:hypothetical protein BSKO_06262 [Bryopsis sp. KO-2023]